MISVIVPTYNHAKHLSRTLDQLLYVFQSYQLKTTLHYEIIVVNDGSQDHTTQVIKTYANQFEEVRGIILQDNVGQQNATLAGLRYARYDYVFTFDDDLKYDPSSIFELKNHLDYGCDVVYGYLNQCTQSPLRYWGTQLKEWIFYCLLNKPKDLCLTSFRGMQRSIVDYVIKDEVPNVYISARILQITTHIEKVQVQPGEVNIQTRYSIKKLLFLVLHILRNYTYFATIFPSRKRHLHYVIKEIFE